MPSKSPIFSMKCTCREKNVYITAIYGNFPFKQYLDFFGKTATKLTYYAYLFLKSYKSNTLYNACVIPNTIISMLIASFGRQSYALTTNESANMK